MPFGPNCEYADMAACVAAHQDKDDPEAYCAEVMRQTEDKCANAAWYRPMAADVKVPAPMPLATVPNVELMHTGSWDISTGEFNVTTDDLTAAVAALDCPAVRRPILKLGHVDPRFDGEPAVGWVANMATAEQGRTLVGDYVGMPGWLGDVVASAYPDRSIEGAYDFRCQIGHTHPFVVTAVALLGVTRPGIGTLESLQDVATLYGVAAALDAKGNDPGGTPVTITVHTQEAIVPNPRPLQVTASVTTEDVRRAYYNGPGASAWDQWIESMQLDPLELIVMNDTSGKRSRIPVSIGEGDGEDAVAFGDPVTVNVVYQDAPATTAASVASGNGTSQTLHWATRTESRPSATTPPAKPDKPTGKGREMPDTVSQGLRARLGLSADADDATVLAKLDEKLGKPDDKPEGQQDSKPEAKPEPQKVAAGNRPRVPEGAVLIDQSAFDSLQASARRADEMVAKLGRDERDAALKAAVADGKIPPARMEHWRKTWDLDPEGTKQYLASMPSNLIPVAALGTSAEPDEFSAEYAALFPPEG